MGGKSFFTFDSWEATIAASARRCAAGGPMKLDDVFDLMIKENASDALLRPGAPLHLRIYGELKTLENEVMNQKEIQDSIDRVLDEGEKAALAKNRGCGGAITYREDWRFRLGVFYQQDKLAIVARKIDLALPEFDKLNLPAKVFEKLCAERRGLILLVGMTGNGKSTTIAAMIEHINRNLGRHILTVEEPIEYVFRDKKSMIHQREVGRDVMDYEHALKQSALLSPDILYVGDIRDTAICTAVLKAAEKGMLVISTMHAGNVQMAIETMVNLFPFDQRERVYYRLSLLLKGVVAQRLIPRDDQPGLIPAYEVMILSPTIASAIAEKRIAEIPKILRESTDMYGMNTYTQCLINLIKEKKITEQTAIDHADNKRDVEVSLSYSGS